MAVQSTLQVISTHDCTLQVKITHECTLQVTITHDHTLVGNVTHGNYKVCVYTTVQGVTVHYSCNTVCNH